VFTPEQSIKATFEIFPPQDGVIEVRAMGDKTMSGYYRDRERLAYDLSLHSNETWYFVMNTVDPACYSRDQSERLLYVTGKMKTTSDKEIKMLRWLLIDADPKRAAGVSSTDEEKANALEIIKRVGAWLRGQGFNDPVFCDSGNGYHLLYRINAEPSESETVKKFLAVLSLNFSDEKVEIDTSVFNPARITKVYGTIATKGASTKERPHRHSGIISVPAEITPTAFDCVRAVAAMMPEPEKPTYRNNYAAPDAFDIDGFIRLHNIEIQNEVKENGTRKLILKHCPFDENHKAPDAAIFVLANGAIGFRCLHNSCRDRRWQDVRKMFEPSYGEFKSQQNRTIMPRPKKDGKPTFPPPKKEHDKAPFLRLSDIEVVDRSQIVSIPTGIDELDKKLIGMNKGELSIWSGGNGSGKSTFLSQLALETVERGFKCAMFSGELTGNRAKSWLHLQAAGRDYTKLADNGVSYYVPRKEAQMIDEWTADKLWIYNNDYGMKIDDVLNEFQLHMEQHDTDVIIIDNLMSLDFSEYRSDKYDNQTMLVLRLSALAKECNVHIHFVCHPRKPNGFLRKADISGTADLTNAADNVFMMHRVNNDFMRTASEYFDKGTAERYKAYTNVIEIMKNRDLGVSDEIVGLFFEPESKRLKNTPQENKLYGWGEDLIPQFFEITEQEAADMPF